MIGHGRSELVLLGLATFLLVFAQTLRLVSTAGLELLICILDYLSEVNAGSALSPSITGDCGKGVIAGSYL